jgi:hypothetical protein
MGNGPAFGVCELGTNAHLTRMLRFGTIVCEYVFCISKPNNKTAMIA